ncbi:hypothetical protein AXF42_Ash005269 [Apostasia shenzhenica]|uniref:Uncharacterized protein n=1 Tax=Apostasia shenzhenica TaxID=1088818 RepID=A0A2I0B6F6_9ASPA|nr:hypothetical protein AXF42_Ash005269 [Apostasia shenzhenica]
MEFPSYLVSRLPSHMQIEQPIQNAVKSVWEPDQVCENLRKLQETIHLLRATHKELQGINLIKRFNGNSEADKLSSNHLGRLDMVSHSNDSFGNERVPEIAKIIKEKRVSLDVQECLSLEAANRIAVTIKNELSQFSAITNEAGPWEEKSTAVKLVQKMRKYKRNKRWRKRKRKHVSQLIFKEREGYDKADRDADEWRTREIAKDIAKRKMESMKAIAKLKAAEEKKRLESELELLLVVEKLQELRSIRIQKMKKQGHFLPEEDDKFLERVRTAVEEEERQATAFAVAHAAKDVIATAEESRKIIQTTTPEANVVESNRVGSPVKQEQTSMSESERNLVMAKTQDLGPKFKGEGFGGAYESMTNLPYEFFHYYHGSSNDMGTLIEVRWTWDAYIRLGGSPIPGHWVQPPTPADEVWASYLVAPKQ